MDVSVCMATYNGERFINEQLKSIMSQIDQNDEVIIIDDDSKDNTVIMVENFNDERIKIFKNETNQGHVYSFNRAITLASNDFIFLADQDDIWIPGRVNLMKKKLKETNALVLSSNFDLLTADGSIKSFNNSLHAQDSTKTFNNILGIFTGKRGYYGCAMAFHKKLTNIVLPIPTFAETHDLWIAMAANLLKANIHIEEKTLIRRIHNNNVSLSSRNLFQKIKSRFLYFITLIYISKRLLILKGRSE